MYVDESLTCIDCGQSFPFTAGEQTFFAEKGFTNKPSRCVDCRAVRKGQKPSFNKTSSSFNRHEKRMFQAVCTTCGSTAAVPFEPKPDKPVYCRDCFVQRARKN